MTRTLLYTAALLLALGAAAFFAAPNEVRYFVTTGLDSVRDAALGPRLPERDPRPATDWSQSLIDSARTQIGVTTTYDPAYVGLSYPMGDIDRRKGVCTDVIIRALRDSHQIDLQERVHCDIAANFARYPDLWGLTKPDRNIDHRRVPNLRRYFERIGADLAPPTLQSDFQPGDVVTWMISAGRPHIGVVSEFTTRDGARPLIIHNAGLGTRMDDFLPLYTLTGHYRLEPHI
ncbi:MAG: DUF1287 domain-containing protein [Shimia sp.]|uniref:DUF1287 domain-containing protein n=1 Tax=Shimia sp. TaxID=1954381 RepID=UPI00405943E1